MRKIIIYIRSLFCKHEWEFLNKTECYYKGVSTEHPVKFIERWRCKKCGYIVKDQY